MILSNKRQINEGCQSNHTRLFYSSERDSKQKKCVLSLHTMVMNVHSPNIVDVLTKICHQLVYIHKREYVSRRGGVAASRNIKIEEFNMLLIDFLVSKLTPKMHIIMASAFSKTKISKNYCSHAL